MVSINIIMLILSGLGLCFFWLMWVIKPRTVKLSCGVLGLSAVGLVGLLSYYSASLMAYQPLTYEQEVAEISFRQLQDHSFQALVQYPNDSRLQRYHLHGDQWQMNVVVIKWQGMTHLLGVDAWYRLERLSGRFNTPGFNHKLAQTEHYFNRDEGEPMWKWLYDNCRWLPGVDTKYEGIAYLPMENLARYKVFVTPSGVMARSVKPHKII